MAFTAECIWPIGLFHFVEHVLRKLAARTELQSKRKIYHCSRLTKLHKETNSDTPESSGSSKEEKGHHQKKRGSLKRKKKSLITFFIILLIGKDWWQENGSLNTQMSTFITTEVGLIDCPILSEYLKSKLNKCISEPPSLKILDMWYWRYVTDNGTGR